MKVKITTPASMLPYRLRSGKPLFFIAASLLCSWQEAKSQKPVTLPEALELSLKNNPDIKTSTLEVERQQYLKRTSSETPKTEVTLMFGQYNSRAKNDNNLNISQTIPFPTTWHHQGALGKAMITGSMLRKKVTENDILYRVASVYIELLYLKAKNELLLRQDSLFKGMLNASEIRYKTGESTLLEKISSETQWQEVQNMLLQNEADQSIYLNQLNMLTGSDQVIDVTGTLEQALPVKNGSTEQNPTLQFFRQEIEVTGRQKKVIAARTLPDIRFGYFNQTMIGYQNLIGQEEYFGTGDRFQGFQVGLSFPLWFGPHSARIKAASIESQMARQKYEGQVRSVRSHYEQALKEFEKTEISLRYYHQYALPNSTDLIRQSSLSFRAGEIDYITHYINMRNALTIRDGYLHTLHEHYQSILRLNYLTGTINDTED